MSEQKTPRFHMFVDVTAGPNMGRWRVGLDHPLPGLVIESLDDQELPYDRVELRRYGAYIVLDRPAIRREFPPSLQFLSAIVEIKARSQAIGIPVDPPPVLVHTSRIEGLFEAGLLPIEHRAKHGSAKLLGVDIVWHEDLDAVAAVR